MAEAERGGDTRRLHYHLLLNLQVVMTTDLIAGANEE